MYNITRKDYDMKIGFIGLGIMGESMSENIIKKHNDTVYVFDVVKEKTDKLAALGGVLRRVQENLVNMEKLEAGGPEGREGSV